MCTISPSCCHPQANITSLTANTGRGGGGGEEEEEEEEEEETREQE